MLLQRASLTNSHILLAHRFSISRTLPLISPADTALPTHTPLTTSPSA